MFSNFINRPEGSGFCSGLSIVDVAPFNKTFVAPFEDIFLSFRLPPASSPFSPEQTNTCILLHYGNFKMHKYHRDHTYMYTKKNCVTYQKLLNYSFFPNLKSQKYNISFEYIIQNKD